MSAYSQFSAGTSTGLFPISYFLFKPLIYGTSQNSRNKYDYIIKLGPEINIDTSKYENVKKICQQRHDNDTQGPISGVFFF